MKAQMAEIGHNTCAQWISGGRDRWMQGPTQSPVEQECIAHAQLHIKKDGRQHYREPNSLCYCKTMLYLLHCPYTQRSVPFRPTPRCCTNIFVETCDYRHDWSDPDVARSIASRRMVANGKYGLKYVAYVQIVTVCDEGESLSPPAGSMRGQTARQ